jgi:hypothetical protein
MEDDGLASLSSAADLDIDWDLPHERVCSLRSGECLGSKALLTGAYRCPEPVLRRRKGTDKVVTVFAPGAVGFIEVNDPFPLASAMDLGFEIQIPPFGVGFQAGRPIAEWDEQPFRAGISPVGLERALLPFHLELEFTPPEQLSLSPMCGLEPDYLLLIMLMELQLKAIRRVNRIVSQALESALVPEGNR